MKTQHTPGPWVVKPTSKNLPTQIYSAIKDNFSHFVADADPATTYHKAIEINERIANARLIAAAPELLEALESVYKHMTAHMPEKVIDQVISAINKAKGL